MSKENYTHVYVEGNARTPLRFWKKILLKETDVKKFKGKTDGYVRPLTELERK